MRFNITYDASAAVAPPGFFATIAAVTAYYEALVTSPVTIDIAVGYGEVDGEAVTSAGESDTTTYGYSYAQIRRALIAQASSAPDLAAVAALPVADPSDGAGFAIPAAEAELLGLSSNVSQAYVGFSATQAWNFDITNTAASGELDFFGVVEHEFSEIMGRISGVGTGTMSVLDLFRYSAPGIRAVSGGGTAYFSLDGGTTDLAHFNTLADGDYGDWASSMGNDAYLAFSASSVANPISAVDLAVLESLGYTLDPAASQEAASATSATIDTGFDSLPDVSAFLTPASFAILAGVIYSLSASGTAVNVVNSAGDPSAAQSMVGRFNALVVTDAADDAREFLPAGYQAGYLLGGSGASLLDSNGAALLVDTAANGVIEGAPDDTLMGGTGDEVLVAGGGAETLIGGSGANLFSLGFGADAVTSLGVDTIICSSGAATVSATADPMVFGGSGALDFIGAGGAPTLIGGGAETVDAGAASALVFGGVGPLVFANGTGASTVVAGAGAAVSLSGGTAPLLFFGNGPTTYQPGAAVDTILGGTGRLTATGGASGALLFGGTAGGNVLNSGAGATTIVGGGNGDLLTASGTGADVIAASSGGATIDGSAAFGDDYFFGGDGADCIVGGAGSTAIVSGTGNDTLVAGAGTTLFTFAPGSPERMDVVKDFNPAADFIELVGFAPGAALAALATATIVGGSTTLALPDGTRILFQGSNGLAVASFT